METDKDVEAFVERIGTRLNESPRAPHSGRHRAAFIALHRLIEGAVSRGYTMKVIWAALREEKKLSMSYQTFRVYCRRARIGQPMRTPEPAPHLRPETPRPADTAARPAPIGASESPQRGFRHERVPRKGDIYG